MDAESNIYRNISTEIINNKSYSFRNLKWYLANDFNREFAMKLSFSDRNDFFAKENELKKASNAKEIELVGKWSNSHNSDLSFSLIGRNLEVVEAELLPNDISKKRFWEGWTIPSLL